MKKWIAVAVLAVAVTARAQAPETETLGAGQPAITCGQPTYPCLTPVINADGSPDGSIAVYVGSTRLMRYGLDGALEWVSMDYDGTNFSTDTSLHGTLSYTLGSVTKCSRSGRGNGYGCHTYHYVSGGTLME